MYNNKSKKCSYYIIDIYCSVIVRNVFDVFFYSLLFFSALVSLQFFVFLVQSVNLLLNWLCLFCLAVTSWIFRAPIVSLRLSVFSNEHSALLTFSLKEQAHRFQACLFWATGSSSAFGITGFWPIIDPASFKPVFIYAIFKSLAVWCITCCFRAFRFQTCRFWGTRTFYVGRKIWVKKFWWRNWIGGITRLFFLWLDRTQW